VELAQTLSSFSRTTNAQSFGKDLKRRGKKARNFTVYFDLDTLIFKGSRDNFSCKRVTYSRHAEVRANVQSRRVSQDASGSEIADSNNVKLSVSQLGTGSEFHSATEIARIRNAKISDSQVTGRIVIDLDNHSNGLRPQCCLQHGSTKRNPAR
jgi:hypothetical protein